MNEFLSVLRWVIVGFICLMIISKPAFIGKKREPITAGDCITFAIINMFIVYFLVKGV